MGVFTDKVVNGDYKNGDIKVKSFGNKVFLVKSGFLKDVKIEINKNTVKSIEVVDRTQGLLDYVGTQTVQAVINFKDGKRSMIEVSGVTYQAINRAMF